MVRGGLTQRGRWVMGHEYGCKYSGQDCERGCDCWDGGQKCPYFEPDPGDGWEVMEIDWPAVEADSVLDQGAAPGHWF